jgi:hypothetical protein
MREYPKDAVERAKDEALEWLTEHTDGYPLSWEQEERENKRRGYEMYDDFEAPPIAGYEALERDGIVVRLERVVRSADQERVHFRMAQTADGQREDRQHDDS